MSALFQSLVSRKESDEKGFRLLGTVLSGSVLFLEVAAIAVPNLHHSPIARNEAVAYGALRTIGEAIPKYVAMCHRYPRYLQEMDSNGYEIDCSHAHLMSQYYLDGTAGYKLVIDGNNVEALPREFGKTGLRSFLLTPDGKVHFSEGRRATAADEEVQTWLDK
jgi:hypothetical protein